MQIIDNQYFSNINYYIILLKNKNVNIVSNYYYEKGWFSNKCTIVGSNGIINLSVPLLGGRNQKTLYKDVKIAYNQNWRQQHLRTIFSCYGNSPFFDYYKYEIENIYQKQFEYLFDFNIFILEKMLKLLKAEVEFTVTEVENIALQNVLCTKKNRNTNSSPILLKYQQVFEDKIGFVPNLSILDLLFCTGTRAKHLLLN